MLTKSLKLFLKLFIINGLKTKGAAKLLPYSNLASKSVGATNSVERGNNLIGIFMRFIGI